MNFDNRFVVLRHFSTRSRSLSFQLTENDRDHRLKLSALDDENQRLKLKHKEEMKEQELIHQRELQRLKESVSASEENFKEQIHKLESIRTTLERVRGTNFL